MRPRQAIEAAQEYLNNPSGAARAAYAAADAAAYAAAYAADTEEIDFCRLADLAVEMITE